MVGPTASGKSELGLNLCERYGGEVVNVDSMQLYRGMDIGTAKLPVAQRRGIPHHQLDVWDVTEPASVARFQKEAGKDIAAIMARGAVPVLVGGSMLYIQSLIDQWRFPPTDPEVRRKYFRLLDEIGVVGLHRRLAEIDPEAAATIEDFDSRRTVRALEVIELTGQPYAASQPVIGRTAHWGTRIIGLSTRSEWLNPRIDKRTRAMFDAGLVDEVRHLVDDHGLAAGSTAGRAIGYAQVLAHFQGELTAEQMVERTITGTRRYVRRQRSWFKRDPRIRWIDATGDTLGQAVAELESHP
ncbi:tRNA (adenosine(37)-N6)-dimethylallyltransferase MiaA [Corynebacterium mendelii]|uniref:tRNA (adenosine(37)-N6)-dimethylallyltransferase MiaA n=1 Tax=Corynebacterium mendelii TaxID=2765362 RepID=UPI0036318353